MKETEIWKTISDYPNYMVSSLGRVKSLNYKRTGKEEILKPCVDSIGYCNVGLCKDNKQKKIYIHRLVAQAFIPNPDNLSQVNHKDENKQNNCVDNLEFCDATYNNTYGTRLERASKACQKSVVQLDKNNNFIKEFSSITQVGNDLNISLGNVSNCCRGKVNFVGGYRWMYLEDYLNNIKKVS
jgi:hypothetical protein